jgi:hypothetical protein
LIDSYGIFRDGASIRWWEIHNYCKQNWDHAGLYEYVTTKKPKFIDATTDPFPEHELVTTVRKNQLDKIAPILVPDLSLAQRYRDLNFVFYPLWILSAIEKTHQQPTDLSFGRTYKLSCLNRQPRLHRFLTYYLLAQMPWFDQIYVSFAGIDCDLGANSEVTSMNQLYELGLEIKNFYDNNRSHFPFSSQQDYHWENCHDTNTPAYVDCWANIVTETSVHAFCVTEKTTKCFTSGALLFPVASKGFVTELASMGFDMDYQGIDFSFDAEPDWRLRVQRCVHEVNRVYDNLENIWQNNLDRIKYNKELFLSNNLLEYCLQDTKNYV